jgi:hypothetical protein
MGGHSYAAGPTTPWDSYGNNWIALTTYGEASTCGFVKMWYAYATAGKVGANHTFQITGGNANAISVTAYSGTDTTSDPYVNATDHGNNTDNSWVTTIQPGSTTPAEAGDLLVTAWSAEDSSTTTLTIDLNFVRTDLAISSGNMVASMAYLITPDANAKNPTWTTFPSNLMAASIAAFKVGGGVPPDYNPPGGGIFAEFFEPSFARRSILIPRRASAAGHLPGGAVLPIVSLDYLNREW